MPIAASRGEPRRVKVIARAGSYHGATVATAPLGGFPGTARAFNLPMDDVIMVKMAPQGERPEDLQILHLPEIWF